MSTRLDPAKNRSRTTDHSVEIAKMREKAGEIMLAHPDPTTCPNETFLEATILMGAAELLEVHDATGISLDAWTGPHEVVISGLLIAGFSRDDFLPNGV